MHDRLRGSLISAGIAAVAVLFALATGSGTAWGVATLMGVLAAAFLVAGAVDRIRQRG